MKAPAAPFLVAFLFALLAAHPVEAVDPAQASLDAAKTAARDYLQAYFRGDAERVVALIHPEALAEGKRLILAQYELARDSESLASFQRTLGLQGDMAELMALDAASLYEKLIEAEHADLSEAEAAALDDTRIEVSEARFLEPDIARVSLVVLGPSATGYDEQLSVIDLALHEGSWLVLGDSPQP